jgi:hypothetical protein
MVMPFPSASKTVIILVFFMIPSCQSAVGPRCMASLSCGTSGRLRSADHAQSTDAARRGSSSTRELFRIGRTTDELLGRTACMTRPGGPGSAYERATCAARSRAQHPDRLYALLNSEARLFHIRAQSCSDRQRGERSMASTCYVFTTMTEPRQWQQCPSR